MREERVRTGQDPGTQGTLESLPLTPCLACGAADWGRASMTVSWSLFPEYHPFFVHEGPLPFPSSHHLYTPPNTHVCTPPNIHQHTPQTHMRTHTPLPPTHIPTRSLHFSRGGRQGKMQEVKLSPRQSIISFLKPKQSRNYQLYNLPLFFFFPSRKGADMIKFMFLNERKNASNTICDTFISFISWLTSLRSPAGCMTVSRHLGLCAILFIYFFYAGGSGLWPILILISLNCND